MHSTNKRKLHLINKISSKKFIIDLCPSDHKNLLNFRNFKKSKKFLDRPTCLDSLQLTPSDHDITSSWEWTDIHREGFIGIATHDNNSSECQFLEVFHILGNVPWKSLIRTDQTRFVHGKHRNNTSHKNYNLPVDPNPPRSAFSMLSTSRNSGFSIFMNIPCPIRSPFLIVTVSCRILTYGNLMMSLSPE